MVLLELTQGRPGSRISERTLLISRCQKEVALIFNKRSQDQTSSRHPCDDIVARIETFSGEKNSADRLLVIAL